MTEININIDKIVMRTEEEVLDSMEKHHQWRMSNDVGYYADQMAKKNKDGTFWDSTPRPWLDQYKFSEKLIDIKKVDEFVGNVKDNDMSD